jgi:hypothetical protein
MMPASTYINRKERHEVARGSSRIRTDILVHHGLGLEADPSMDDDSSFTG